MTEAKIRRYSIEVKDIDSETTVLLTAVDWTDVDKRIALARIMRPAGVPDGAGDCFLDDVAPRTECGKD
jgi:hypothetical protein